MEGPAGLTLTRVLTNFITWPLIQLAIARLFLSLPARWFQSPVVRSDYHAREMRFYRATLHIRQWKGLLPDGARWLGDEDHKKSVRRADRRHLLRFVQETRRAEATHYAAFASLSLTLLWNPRFTWPGLIVLALLLNAPCILVQRYNRAALLQWLRRNSRTAA